MAEAGTEGSAKIEKKLAMVRSYMWDAWSIDLDKLREVVLRRTNDILASRVDLTDLTY